jgi:hypothetical protein
MNKEHIDNILLILDEFYNLTKDINFNIKRYPYIQQYIPNEIKKILDKDLYVILNFFGNENFYKEFSSIKNSSNDLKKFNSYIDNTKYNNIKKYGGHAVVIKSYEENSMIITNSWGTKWGNLGYLKIDKNIFLNKSYMLPFFVYIDINKKILKQNINKLSIEKLSILYNSINKNKYFINENKYFINLNNNNCDKNNNKNNNENNKKKKEKDKKKKEKDKKYILNKIAGIIKNNKK